MNVTDIRIEDYNYPLPDERIARYPLAQRDSCKLLVRRHDGMLSEHRFSEVADLLLPGTMLVYNNTKVINARVRMAKASGAAIEIFCLEPAEPRDYAQSFGAEGRCSWHCFVGNSKRWKSGPLEMRLTVDGREAALRATRTARTDAGSVVEFEWTPSDLTFSQIISAAGEIPIPPYLNRASEASDTENYQTVFSRIEGSVAAPTAGLHFTPEVLADIDSRSMVRREITLHVGAGTFQPVKSDTIGEHAMHSEFISVPVDLIEEIARGDRPVTAVGTTSVRTLESLYHLGCMAGSGMEPDEVPQWYPYSPDHPALTKVDALNVLVGYARDKGMDRVMASTRIIIAPGYRFRVVDAMITNFHQPQSTLLLLVSAFTGGDWRPMYDYALGRDFRFLSYGDASLLL